jgi:large subunit ribosomal protein L17
MRKRVYGRKLSRDTNERKALFRSLATALFVHGAIDTTEAKAKAVRPWVEKLITQGKTDSLHSRRLLLSRLPNPKIIDRLITAVGPTFANRPGGYTRVIRLGPRASDSAPIVRLEFVEVIKEVRSVKPKKVAVAKPAKVAAKRKVTVKRKVEKKVVRKSKK